MVNIHQSTLVRIISRLFPKMKTPINLSTKTLIHVNPGFNAKVLGFSINIPSDRPSHLQAYGLTAGREVLVLQHSPVTIIQVDHTELALEKSLADMVEVE
jgi:Fe2+ transport system protein FeoA